MSKKQIRTCENCEHCMYYESGDMYCDLEVEKQEIKWVYEDFIPTDDYWHCGGRKWRDKYD